MDDFLPVGYADVYWRDFPEGRDEECGTVRWFGRPWPSSDRPAPVCRPDAHIPTPKKFYCLVCERPFKLGDRGVRIPHLGETRRFSHYHLDCFVLTVLGGSQ